MYNRTEERLDSKEDVPPQGLIEIVTNSVAGDVVIGDPEDTTVSGPVSQQSVVDIVYDSMPGDRVVEDPGDPDDIPTVVYPDKSAVEPVADSMIVFKADAAAVAGEFTEKDFATVVRPPQSSYIGPVSPSMILAVSDMDTESLKAADATAIPIYVFVDGKQVDSADSGLNDTVALTRKPDTVVDPVTRLDTLERQVNGNTALALTPVKTGDGDIVHYRAPSATSDDNTSLKSRLQYVRRLARGGMGSVDLVKDGDGRELVYKQICIGQDNPETRDLLRQAIEHAFFEREVLAQVKSTGHTSAPVIFEAGQDGKTGRFYIAMEYVEGRSLRDIIRDEGLFDITDDLRLDQKILISMGVALDLDNMHQQGDIHRDVKPSNILVTDTDARLLDFGLAKPAGERVSYENDGDCYGTPSFMAPEAYFQKEDARSDQFSLCAMMYELFSGRNPIQDAAYDIDTAQSEIEQQVDRSKSTASCNQPEEDDPPVLIAKYKRIKDIREVAEVPAEVADIIMKGLSYKPEDRHESCGQMLDALRTAYQQSIPPDEMVTVKMLIPDA